MSDTELDKTIEELEAEVLAELEEAGDPTKKGAAPAEKSDEIDEKTPGGEVQDTGKAVVEPDQANSPGKEATAKASQVSGDKTKKAAKPADKPEKIAAGDEVDHDGDDLAEDKKLTKAQHLEAIGKMKKADIEEMIAFHAAKLAEAEMLSLRQS